MNRQQIIDAALFDASERADSEFRNSANRYLKQVYNDVLNQSGVLFEGIQPLKDPWPFLIKNSTFILEHPISTGTVSATQGSPTISFSTSIPKSVAGWHFRVEGNPDIYVVQSHTAGSSSAVLDSPYTGASGTSLTYTLFKIDYDLPSDFKRFVEPLMLNDLGFKRVIAGIDIIEFNDRFPLAAITYGPPSFFAFTYPHKIRFNALGRQEQLTRIDCRYVFMPPSLELDSDVPVLPEEYRSVLHLGTTYYLMLSKNDDRAVIYQKMVQAKLTGMIDDYRKMVISSGAIMKLSSRIWTRPISESGVIF